MMDFKECWPLWLINFLINNKGSGVSALSNKSAIKSIPQNEKLADELHRSIIRKF